MEMKLFPKPIIFLLFILCSGLMLSCSKSDESKTSSTSKGGVSQMKIEQSAFGKTRNGQDVSLFTLQNAAGMKVTLTNYGGIVTSLYAPDRNGNFDDVVVGF